jgi:phosphoserine phosphatase
MIRLVCFDLDGTLVDDTIFIWQTLHDFFGTPAEKRKELAESYFTGRISYAEWAESEIRDWIEKGADRKKLMTAISGLKLMPGVREVLIELKKRDLRLAIISGSLSFVIEEVLPDYTEFFADEDILISRLDFDMEGRIAGIRITEYDMERKAMGLKMLAERHGIGLQECAFIGDHSNDVEVAREAGLSIAFNSKSEQLDAVADHIVEGKDLRSILRFL